MLKVKVVWKHIILSMVNEWFALCFTSKYMRLVNNLVTSSWNGTKYLTGTSESLPQLTSFCFSLLIKSQNHFVAQSVKEEGNVKCAAETARFIF